MHLTRVAVTLALAVSTANALPWSRSQDDSADTAGVNADNLDTTRDIYEKGPSPDSMNPYGRVAVSSNQPLESSNDGQPIQKEMVEGGSSLTASQKVSLGRQRNIMESHLAGAAAPDKQSEGMIHLTRAAGSQLSGQSSAISSCSNKIPAVEQNAMEIHQNAAMDASRSENKINFAVKARGLFRAFGQAWDQRAKLEHGEQQQGVADQTSNARQGGSQVFMSTDKMSPASGQRQQAADSSMSRLEKVREVRNHENYHQTPENESADMDAQQHNAMGWNQNHARSHMDGSDAQADEARQMNTQQHLNHEQYQGQQESKQMDMQEAGCSHQQQQTQEQMQSRSEVTKDLQSGMKDYHSLHVNEHGSEQSHA